ncbi:MAG: fibronectin type III domain-containing protein [Eubacteriales bacterium]|nr:fibronectin type III domain-containing protein [Eubacteriales bacterium]
MGLWKKNLAMVLAGYIGIIGCMSPVFAEDEKSNNSDSQWYGDGALLSESGDAEEEPQVDISLWTGTNEEYNNVKIGDAMTLAAKIINEQDEVVEDLEQYDTSYSWYRVVGEEKSLIEGAADNELEIIVDENMARCDRPYYFECLADVDGTEIVSRFMLMTKHTPINDPEVPATGSKTGLTEGSHCEVCGQVIVKQNTIPKVIADTPVLIKTYNTVNSIEVFWKLSEKAEKYRLFRRSNNNGWKAIADLDNSVNHYSDTTVANNTTYFYTVRCLAEDGSTYMSGYNRTGIGGIYMKVPKITEVKSLENSVKISYNSVTGAEKYRVYRKTEDTAWKSVGCTGPLYFVDKTVKSGVDYTYAVRAANGAGVPISSYDAEGKSIFYVAMPRIKKVTADMDGAMISWDHTAGSEKYRVFRKTSAKGKWTLLGETTNNFFLDQTVKNNNTYFYTIRSLYEAEKWTSYDKTGTRILYIEAPKLISAQNGADGITIKWKAVAGADKYRVFRKKADEGWEVVADTRSLTCTDKKAGSGTEYTYTVRCINAAGKYISAYDKTGVSALRIGNGTLQKISATEAGIRLSWKEIAGSDRYVIQRADEKNGYEVIAEITDPENLYYLDSDAAINGMNYKYAVRACIGEEKGTVTPQTFCYLTSPTIGSLKNTAKGEATIAWNKNTKADGYQISYKTGNTEKRFVVDGNAKIKTVVKNLKKGSTYTVKVRSYKKRSGVAYWSAWSGEKDIVIRK